MNKFISFFFCISLTCSLFLSSAWSCGVNSHMWITDSAICQLAAGTQIRDFYTNQTYVDLTRLGSVFPDSGYAINHEYGEVAHWSPFVEAYIQNFLKRYPHPDAWDETARQEVAFLLGAMSHGIEDEWFDTQFLRWVEQEDGAGQDIIDSGLDFLLLYEGHSEIFPPLQFPTQILLTTLQDMAIDLSEAQVNDAMSTVHGLALRLSQNPSALESLVEMNRPLVPWAYEHYLDANYEGSYTHLSQRVAYALESTWLQLRGEWNPQHLILDWEAQSTDPFPLIITDTQDESRWMSLYFALGVDSQSLHERVRLVDELGESIPIATRGSRWGGMGYSRIYEIAPLAMPAYVLSQAEWHIQGLIPMWIEIDAGLTLVNGDSITQSYRKLIYTRCPDHTCTQGSMPENVDTQVLRVGGDIRGCWVEDHQEDLDMMMPLANDMSINDMSTVPDIQVVHDMQATRDMQAIRDMMITHNESIPTDMKQPLSTSPTSNSSGCVHLYSNLNLISRLDFMVYLLLLYFIRMYRPQQQYNLKNDQSLDS